VLGDVEVQDSPPIIPDHENPWSKQKLIVGTAKKSIAAMASL